MKADLTESELIADEVLLKFSDHVKQPLRMPLHEIVVNAADRHLAHKPIFVPGNFISHSGRTLSWKVEADSFTDLDWEGHLQHAKEKLPPFRMALGIPRGGLKFAVLLNASLATRKEEDPYLIVDDVLTTGESMIKALATPEYKGTAFGLVVFARGIVPPGVQWLWRNT